MSFRIADRSDGIVLSWGLISFSGIMESRTTVPRVIVTNNRTELQEALISELHYASWATGSVEVSEATGARSTTASSKTPSDSDFSGAMAATLFVIAPAI